MVLVSWFYLFAVKWLKNGHVVKELIVINCNTFSNPFRKGRVHDGNPAGL